VTAASSAVTGAVVCSEALRHNLRIVRQRAPRSQLMAVVKSDAYGHGLTSVARALESVDAFAVARLEEALALRRCGIRNRIALLEGVQDRAGLEAAAAADLELIVHCAEQIELLRAAGSRAKFKVWIKLDTGMNRLGFKPAAFREAHAALRALAAVRPPVNLFTHLASADAPELPATARQLELFEALTRALPGERSIVNSAGLLDHPEAQSDWVRPGLLLYGASPFAGSSGADYGLRPAMTFSSSVIALKDVTVGERVGYGGEWAAVRPTRLAIAAVGYGDGYPRSLPSGSPVLINGERALLAGRVSMGMIGIDVTAMQTPPILGDRVVLWGEGLPVEEIAIRANTIPYELLCGISQRVATRCV
jgi:alanine racemase